MDEVRVLSNHDARTLAEIEQQLSRSDKALAVTLGQGELVIRRRLRNGSVLGFLLAITLIIVGTFTLLPPLFITAWFVGLCALIMRCLAAFL